MLTSRSRTLQREWLLDESFILTFENVYQISGTVRCAWNLSQGSFNPRHRQGIFTANPSRKHTSLSISMYPLWHPASHSFSFFFFFSRSMKFEITEIVYALALTALSHPSYVQHSFSDTVWGLLLLHVGSLLLHRRIVCTLLYLSSLPFDTCHHW